LTVKGKVVPVFDMVAVLLPLRLITAAMAEGLSHTLPLTVWTEGVKSTSVRAAYSPGDVI
jgi:hypothetical protein